jgi:S-methylmethionine-dependent homocysteine/selenocysteine methylase
MTGITILDGGTGRELKRIGAPFRQPEWSALALIEAPAFVTQVHQRYVDAGADVITTNTYAIVPFHIGAERHARDGARLAALAGALARDVADRAGRPVAVAGSLPPVCGSYRADLFDAAAARPLVQVLVDALRDSVDHWQGETLSAIEEARLLREVIGDDGKPLWLSFTLSDDGTYTDVPRLRSGETVADAMAAAIQLGARAVLFNCSQPEVMADAVNVAAAAAATAAIPVAIGVYANAFPPMRKDATANETVTEIRADLDPPGYLAFAQAWVACGATIVGGCCGIGPEHIAVLRAAL